jgi:hypothetical protein
MADNIDEDQRSLVSTQSLHISAFTVTKLVKRLRAMTLKLLPVQVELGTLSDPTSRIITPQVIEAYRQAAGDFVEALPYCLLRARQSFIRDANRNVSDYDENMGRARACEVLARRIVHLAPPERLHSFMSSRFRHLEWDGDESASTSALENAIDQDAIIFLSSNEAQHAVNCLWRGDWIQKNNANNDIDYVEYNTNRHGSFWSHIDPSRLAVPRYQNWFRIIVWLFFLFVYSRSVHQPIEQATDPRHRLDEWEIVLYIMSLSFAIENFHKIYKMLRFFTYRAFGFWTVVSLLTDVLLVVAFAFRIAGLKTAGEEQSAQFKLRSFQILSCVAPLIWMKLITVFDGFKYVGTMQICVARMMQESLIFFILLSVLLAGFAQGMYAIDASDGREEEGAAVLNTLLQALLQAPDFERPAINPFGLTLYYLWNIVTTVILLNILISLFSSAYADVTDDAEAEFLAFFAGRTIGMIRAPDDYVYPSPFNIIEIIVVSPWEVILSQKVFAKLNRAVMSVVFFIPLCIIAVFEAQLDTTKNKFMYNLFGQTEEGEEDDPANQDPLTEHEDGEISKVAFSELIKVFPNSYQSSEAVIVNEIKELRKRVDELATKNKVQRTTDGTSW